MSNRFTAFIGRLFSSTGLTNPEKGFQLGAINRTSTASGTTVTDERALKLAGVWACVQLIANSMAGLPISVMRETDDGKEKPKSREFLSDLLKYRPNRYMKPRDFRSAMTVQMALWNNAYAQILYSGERPVALMPFKPGRMTPFIADNGDLQYHYAAEEGVKIFSPKSVLHLKGITIEGIVGAERNNFSRESMGLAAAAETFAAKQFANGGRPGGVIAFDEWLDEDQRAQAKKLYEGLSEGAINANRLWCLEGGAKYEQLDATADQLQMLATREFQLGDICRFYGVPPVLIGAGDGKGSAWPASFEQQMLAFLTFTLQAYVDEWEAAIAYSLIRPGSNFIVEHDVTPLVKMDSTAKANYFSRLAQNGFMTRNEGRVKLGMPKVDDPKADELTIQTNLNTLGLFGEENAPNQRPVTSES